MVYHFRLFTMSYWPTKLVKRWCTYESKQNIQSRYRDNTIDRGIHQWRSEFSIQIGQQCNSMVSYRRWTDDSRASGGDSISEKDICRPETYGVRKPRSKLVASVAPREIARSTTNTPTSRDQYHKRAGSPAIGSSDISLTLVLSPGPWPMQRLNR